MRNKAYLFCLMAALAVSCIKEQQEAIQPMSDYPVFYASIEEAGDPGTRVFVDDDLMVLWHADDRVSIFNKYTYNQQYRFTGNTGANSGSFTKVPNDDFVTGNTLSHVYAIYPYHESTEISNQGVLTIDLPATQSYAENSFGVGANTMVSCSEGNELLFKNLCGYIMLKLYGDDVTVKSISIKGNNDEPLAGKATVSASVDNAPSLTFDASATKDITLNFDTPVTLGSTAETATTFWLVVPPTTFSKGITLTVKDDKNGEFKKSTTASLQISRNTLKRLTALQVTPEPSDDAIVFADQAVKALCVSQWDTNGDGELSYAEAAVVQTLKTGPTKSLFSNNEDINSFEELQFFTGLTEIGFGSFIGCSNLKTIIIPEGVVSIGGACFDGCSSLCSIFLPDSVLSIGTAAFQSCERLSSIELPKGLTSLGSHAFFYCPQLTYLVVPEGVTDIGEFTFSACYSLKSVSLPNVTSIGHNAFEDCSGLTSIDMPKVNSIGSRAFLNCSSLMGIVIPEGVTGIPSESFSNCSMLSCVSLPNTLETIGGNAFEKCSSLTSISIPDSVTRIGSFAFYQCSSLTSLIIPKDLVRIQQGSFHGCSSLTSITIFALSPPPGADYMFTLTNNCPIYVPAESVEAYKTAQYWSEYAGRIQPID